MPTQHIVNTETLAGTAARPLSINTPNDLGGSGVELSDNSEKGFIIGQSARRTDAGETEFSVHTINLDSDHLDTSIIPVHFLGHGLAFHPKQSTRAALFEKRGKGACEIDFATGKVIRTIETADNRQFYGHGCFGPDGKTLYSAETITEGEFEGVIVMRDAETLEEIGTFPSYGNRPHDCQLLKDKKTMVITNGGGLSGEKEKGSVTFVDIETHKLIKKLPIENKRLNAGHVSVSPNGDIAVVSAPREGLDFAKDCGGVTLGDRTKGLRGGNAPRKLLDSLKGESLSVTIDHERRIAATTTPEGSRVGFWDLKLGKLVHSVKVEHPRGVTKTQDGKYFVINYGRPQAKIGLIEIESFEPVPGFDIGVDISGSHIVSYSF